MPLRPATACTGCAAAHYRRQCLASPALAAASQRCAFLSHRIPAGKQSLAQPGSSSSSSSVAAAAGRAAVCCRAFSPPDSSSSMSSNPTSTGETSTTPQAVATRTSQPPGHLETTFGAYSQLFNFSDTQLEVIAGLRTSIANSAVAFSAVAATNILLSSVQAFGLTEGEESAATIFGGFTVGDVAYWVDSTMLVTLLLFALGPLDTVIHSRINQMNKVFQGLNRLGLIFQQLIIGSFAVSTVTLMEAAVKYPPIVVFSSEVFFAVAILRAAAMGYVLRTHTSSNDEVVRTLGALRGCEGVGADQKLSLPERWAVLLAFGYLLQYEEKKPFQSMDGDDTQHYEFTTAEERTLKNMTESVNTAGLALGLQAFSTLMLTVAEFGTEDWSGVVSNGINCTNKVLMAALVFHASQSFDRALHTEGDDVDHLLDGLGEEGLTDLFDKLSILAWAVSVAAMVGVAAPWMEDSVALTALSDAASHHTAEMVVDAMETAAKVMRGI